MGGMRAKDSRGKQNKRREGFRESDLTLESVNRQQAKAGGCGWKRFLPKQCLLERSESRGVQHGKKSV